MISPLNWEGALKVLLASFRDELEVAVRAELQPALDAAVKQAMDDIDLRVHSAFNAFDNWHEVKILVEDRRPPHGQS